MNLETRALGGVATMNGKFRKSVVGALAICAAAAFTFEASAQTHRQCDREARNYADDTTPAGGNIVGGAAAGAIGGAIVGGIIGGSRGAASGAAIGGGAGALGGAGRSSVQWQNAYDYAYDRCMDGY